MWCIHTQKGQMNKHQGLIFPPTHLSMYQRLARHSTILRSYPFSLASRGAKKRTHSHQWQEFLGGNTVRNSLAAHTTEWKEDATRNGSMFSHESQVAQFGYKRPTPESLVLELHRDFLLSVMLLGFSLALFEPGHSLHVHSWLRAMRGTLK